MWTILDRINLVLGAGPPNGADRAEWFRQDKLAEEVAMGLLAPSSGRLTWAGRELHPTLPPGVHVSSVPSC